MDPVTCSQESVCLCAVTRACDGRALPQTAAIFNSNKGTSSHTNNTNTTVKHTCNTLKTLGMFLTAGKYLADGFCRGYLIQMVTLVFHSKTVMATSVCLHLERHRILAADWTNPSVALMYSSQSKCRTVLFVALVLVCDWCHVLTLYLL